MSDTREFLVAFRDFMALGNRGSWPAPTGLIEQWASFVSDCEEGYEDNIYEFHNDLYVRQVLEEILQSSDLAQFEQMKWVRAEVDAIDVRYRSLLIDHEVQPGAPWWKARVPRAAGQELADEFRARYGLEVDVCD